MTSPRALLYFCFMPCKPPALCFDWRCSALDLFHHGFIKGGVTARKSDRSSFKGKVIVPCLQSSGGLTQAFAVQCALYLGIVIKHNWVYTIQYNIYHVPVTKLNVAKTQQMLCSI